MARLAGKSQAPKATGGEHTGGSAEAYRIVWTGLVKHAGDSLVIQPAAMAPAEIPATASRVSKKGT